MQKPLFNHLFLEDFNSISSSDADGTVNGIKSPYSVPAEDALGIVIDNIKDNRKLINSKITKMYHKYQYHITLMTSMDVMGFKEFSNRLVKTLQLNKLFEDDDIICRKLADILTYVYASLLKDTGYVIYDDINKAKKIARLVFSRAKLLGLNFFSPDVEDTLKTVLFSVFFKIDHKKASNGSGNNQGVPK